MKWNGNQGNGQIDLSFDTGEYSRMQREVNAHKSSKAKNPREAGASLQLLVYGTFRRGEVLAGMIPSTWGNMQVMAVPGLQMFVMGDFPAVKVGDDGDHIIAEVWNLGFKNEGVKEWFLSQLDQAESVDKGLYERKYVDIPGDGKALVYVCKMSVKGMPKITDWKKWQELPEDVKRTKLAEGGGPRGVIVSR